MPGPIRNRIADSYVTPVFCRYTILQPQFELNPAHPIIKKLNDLRAVNPQLAILVTEQLFANSMVSQVIRQGTYKYKL